MSQEIRINKGVELMLRRELKEDTPPEPSGFKISQTLSFLKKKFTFRFEFTWEDR
jgi:hypothetical protein